MMQEYTGEVVPLTEYTGEVLPLAGRPVDKSAQESEFIKRELTSPLRKIANVVGSVVEPALQMGSAFFAKPSSEIAGMAAAGRELVSPIGGDPEAFKRSLAEQLTYEPRTTGGKFVSEKILAPIGGVIEAGAEKIGEGAKYLTGSDIAASGIKEAAMQGVGFLGVKGAPAASESIRAANIAKATALSNQKAMESLRNSIRSKGQSIGLIAPAEGVIKETISKIGGVEPYISLKNTRTATNAIAGDVGLPRTAISDVDITTRVGQLSADYGNVTKALGDKVKITPKFKAGVNDLLRSMKEQIRENPSVFKEHASAIDMLEQQLQLSTLKPSVFMESIRKLRENARATEKNQAASIAEINSAKTSYKLANFYEDLIEQSLGDKTALLNKFRDSRKKLAQIHVIDAARTTEGLIDMQKLASITGRYGADKRMVTGNIKIVADFANTFKNVSKPTGKEGFQVPSRWELPMALSGIAASAATGGTSLILATPIAARAIAPSLAERGMLQGKPQSYKLSKSRRLAPRAVEAGMLGGAWAPYAEEQQ